MHTLSNSRLTTVSGLALIAGALLTVFFMLHHPSTSAGDLAGALDEIGHEAAISAWVHGLLILVLAGIWFGCYGLTRRLGSGHTLPVLGFMLFTLGVFAYMLAALVSGFIVSEIALYFAGAPVAEMQQAGGFLRANWAANQAFANAGLIGTSLGILCWSVAMLLRQSLVRLAGVVGIMVAALPAVLLVTGHLQLHVLGMTIVVVANSIWYLMTGVLMVWGALRAQD